MPNENILKNIKLNIIMTTLLSLLGFLSNKYFSIYLGIEALGLMKLFSQLIAYLNMSELGIGVASTYALYKPILENDKKKINIIISTIDSFYKKVAIFIIVVGSLLNLILPYIVENNIFNKKIYLYWTLYILNTAAGYMFAKYSILFVANQEYGFVRKIQGSIKITTQIIQISILIYFQSFILYILAMIIENFFNYYFFYKYYKKNYSHIELIKEKDKTIIKNMRNLFWHKIGSLIVYNTDFIIISKFLSLSTIAVYGSYLMVCRMVMIGVDIITPVISPITGKLIAENSLNEEKIYDYWKKTYCIYMLIGTIFIFITYKMINPFVNLWLGEKYLLPMNTIILILINLFIDITRNPTEIFKNNSGFFEDTYVPVIESILNLTVSLILVRIIGLNGVVVGTITSNILIIYLLKPMLTFEKCFNKRKVDYLKNLYKYIFFSVITILVSELIIRKIVPNYIVDSWIKIILLAIKVTITATITGSIVFSADKTFRRLLYSAKNRLKISYKLPK